MSATKTLSRYGWRVELDRAQVIPSDPGAGTPAMVYAPSGASGTYWCVCDTGEIDCGSEDVPPNVARWLDDIHNTVEDFLSVAMRAPHVCTCCGEDTETGADCCTDNFAEPGELRELA